MGSWNATCAISKLPIHDFDPVCDFLIGEVGSHTDRGFLCYSNDLWAPLTMQVYGKYADYGQIDHDVNYQWHVDFVISCLKKCLVELEQGKNEYHIPVKRDALDFSLVQEAIHESRLFVNNPQWVLESRAWEKFQNMIPAPPEFTDQIKDINEDLKKKNDHRKNRPISVSRMMVHKFVFDEIISWGLETWDGSISLNELIKQGMIGVEKLRNMPGGSSLNDKLIRGMEFWRHSEDDKFLQMLTYTGENGDLYLPTKFKNYMDLLNSHLDDNKTESVVEELSKFIIFRAQMNRLNLLWSPQIGTQNFSEKSLKKLYQVCINKIDKNLEEYGSEE